MAPKPTRPAAGPSSPRASAPRRAARVGAAGPTPATGETRLRRLSSTESRTGDAWQHCVLSWQTETEPLAVVTEMLRWYPVGNLPEPRVEKLPGVAIDHG